jgi:hypothetical protein
MVPSTAMGRDIPVAFLAGGPHAVYPLDAFDARLGCQQLADGGSRHANPCWEAHFRGRACGAAHTACTPIGSRAAADNGETFLSGELPAGTESYALCHCVGTFSWLRTRFAGQRCPDDGCIPPDHFRYAGSVSGVLDAVEKPLATRQ